MYILLILLYMIMIFLMSIGFACIGYDLGCKDTERAYQKRECKKCKNYKTMKCPNSNKCNNLVGKPYFTI